MFYAQYKLPTQFTTLLVAALSTLSSGCGTTIGNPVVVLESTPYDNAGAPLLISNLSRTLLSPDVSQAAITAVSDFRFCLTKLKLKNADGHFVTKDGAESIEAKLGLINVSNPTATKTWGEVTVPTDFLLRELKVELHHDPQLCGGADFSVSYNGQSIRKDLEFKFKFDPPVALVGGETFQLNLSNISVAFGQAEGANALNDEDIADFVNDNVEGSGKKR